MEDFPANSARARVRPEGAPPDRTERRGEAIEQVTSTEAQQRKRGIGRKFKDTFVGGSARGALEYMIVDVVVPAIQDTLIDAFQGGVERLIKGESRSRRVSASSYSGLGHVNYQGMSTNKSSSATRSLSRQSRTRHDFREIIIQHRDEAQEVLDQMFEILSRYGSVAVSDLYELTGIQSGHTDHKWGWVSLRGSRVERLRDGTYLLNIPNPEPF